MPNRGLIAVIPILITACSTDIKPDQIARVEQNFDKIKPGMTREQVRALIGHPLDINDKLSEHEEIGCSKCEVWLLYSNPENYLNWPQVAFDVRTGKVTKVFRIQNDRFFAL
jgi:hypothetical protein